MQLRGVKQLARLNERLGLPKSWIEGRTSLERDPASHYRWPCGCIATTSGPGVVAWVACELHVHILLDD